LLCDCSCPCDFNCKHAVALLLKWISEKDKYTNIKSGKSKKESIEEILNKKSKEELIGLLLTIFIRHQDLTSLIRIDKTMVSKIRALFSDFWEWDEVGDLVERLETILDGININMASVNKDIVNEMFECAKIMIDNYEHISGESNVPIFIEKWFAALGDIFLRNNPTEEEKKEFIKKIIDFDKRDEYGFDRAYEEALIAICESEGDIKNIKELLKEENLLTDEDRGYYEDFILRLYDKIGLDEIYLEIAKNLGKTSQIVDKLASLGKFKEALEVCEDSIKKKSSSDLFEKKIKLLKKLGESKKYKEVIFTLCRQHGRLSDIKKLKSECSDTEWQIYLEKIISGAQKKRKYDLLSRLYYGEKDYENAYKYSKSLTDLGYLELLAKKLSNEHSELACEIYTKLCHKWINSGTGYCYKKAGRLLEAIKKIDKSCEIFNKVKRTIISQYNLKWSLMKIIKKE